MRTRATKETREGHNLSYLLRIALIRLSRRRWHEAGPRWDPSSPRLVSSGLCWCSSSTVQHSVCAERSGLVGTWVGIGDHDLDDGQ